MNSLREIPRVRQTPGSGLRRRWFTSRSADLFVWQDQAAEVVRFEYCFGKPHDEHSLSWSRKGGFRSAKVDDGEASAMRNRTPIAVSVPPFDLDEIAEQVERAAAEVDPEVYRVILRLLRLRQ